MADLPNPAENALAVQDDDGKDAVFEGILETLQSNNILLGEIDENTESDETASEKRERRVEAENTDPPPDKKGMFSSALGGLGAGIKGVGGILNKANPFQEGGLGTKMSILLISGVLFAISKFGDKLVEPLAAVLKMFDSEGSVFEKLKETELFKGVIEKFNLIKDYAKNELADDVANLLEAAMSVGSLIKSAYDSIVAYVSQFDKTGAGPAGQYADGKLDVLEMQNLKDDLILKAGKLVTDIVSSVMGNIGFWVAGFFLLGGIGYNILKGIALGTAARIAAGFSLKGAPSADGPNKRSSKSSVLKRIATRTASAFTIGSTAMGSSIGGTANSMAKLTKDMKVNSVGRAIYTKTGQYVAGSALNPSKYNLSHLAKYPGLIKIAQRAPFLAPILGGYDAIKLFGDPNATHDDKAVGLGRIFGEVGGAALFAKIGGALGTMALPGWGTAFGAITGALGGYYAGGHIGEQLARFMLGDKPLMGEFGSQNIGATLNTSTGTVEGLPIQTMSGTSGYETNAGVNDQYYDGEVPTMAMISSSNDHQNFSQANAVSLLKGNLMNRNSDLAIAAYEADNAKKLSNATPLPGGRGDVSIGSTGSTSFQNTNQNFSTVSANSLKVDDDSTSARLLGPAFVPGGSPLLNF